MKPAAIQVVIMCKAPVAGRVKTRLMSRYTADEAATLHAAMATTVIQRAGRLFDDVVIAADDAQHPFFQPFALPVVSQGEGDLGARMQRQIERAMHSGAAAVLLLGTDSPHMPDARLMTATDALKDVDIVLGPVEDGGYDLIGMNRALSLFDGVAWSSAHVLSQTLANIRRQQLTFSLLDASFDVDFPADIDRAILAGWQLNMDDVSPAEGECPARSFRPISSRSNSDC